MESTGESAREGARAERIHVLYVAAESTAGDALEREDRRFETTAVTSARAGLERLETTPVDCIVSECDLSGMDALSFLRAVRERDETLPFLLFPAAGSEELASRAISAGVTDYVQQGDGPSRYPVLATRIADAHGWSVTVTEGEDGGARFEFRGVETCR
ncbi:response regulator [Haloterrigena alkaliphila]|uniref:Response regulator n=1 Tax=Haloterrigena alkaliphila TaxID=2816475 RepID=A0A8A2VIM7_9EURY|nr:response regulator [Haloterrigena alkaliphila]QSX00183.1 response regulator [Haloterrigena alkaliphila]